MIRVDVSEVKSFKECKRKHYYSSRNRMHLIPNTSNDNLIFGTQFHEVLHMFYLGTSLDKVLEWIDKEVKDSVQWKVMDCMAKGYYNGPYQEDVKKYAVIDIEKAFNIPVGIVGHPEISLDAPNIKLINDQAMLLNTGEYVDVLYICGSIDMLCIDVKTGKLVGFEHKTAKNFRPEIYNLIDEQPRVYMWAMKHILEDYHKNGKYLEVTDIGPIYLNQVKKLQTKFDYLRSACEYDKEDLNNFMTQFIKDAQTIASNSEDNLPQPGFMKCQMCAYADLCMHYVYRNIDVKDLLKEFEGEYAVRDHDHLDEKAERHNDDD